VAKDKGHAGEMGKMV